MKPNPILYMRASSSKCLKHITIRRQQTLLRKYANRKGYDELFEIQEGAKHPKTKGTEQQ